MALLETMRRRPPTRPKPDPCEARLSGRIADLELRIRLLEARVRASAAEEARRKALEAGTKPPPPPRPRPRCPGCLLELPSGRRGEACVWCGFRFEALKARASR